MVLLGRLGGLASSQPTPAPPVRTWRPQIAASTAQTRRHRKRRRVEGNGVLWTTKPLKWNQIPHAGCNIASVANNSLAQRAHHSNACTRTAKINELADRRCILRGPVQTCCQGKVHTLRDARVHRAQVACENLPAWLDDGLEAAAVSQPLLSKLRTLSPGIGSGRLRQSPLTKAEAQVLTGLKASEVGQGSPRMWEGHKLPSGHGRRWFRPVGVGELLRAPGVAVWGRICRWASVRHPRATPNLSWDFQASSMPGSTLRSRTASVRGHSPCRRPWWPAPAGRCQQAKGGAVMGRTRHWVSGGHLGATLSPSKGFRASLMPKSMPRSPTASVRARSPFRHRGWLAPADG